MHDLAFMDGWTEGQTDKDSFIYCHFHLLNSKIVRYQPLELPFLIERGLVMVTLFLLLGLFGIAWFSISLCCFVFLSFSFSLYTLMDCISLSSFLLLVFRFYITQFRFVSLCFGGREEWREEGRTERETRGYHHYLILLLD
jgi:hypothetical protein